MGEDFPCIESIFLFPLREGVEGKGRIQIGKKGECDGDGRGRRKMEELE